MNSFTRMPSDAPLNVSITQRHGTRNDENSRETGYEKRTQKLNEGVRASDKNITNNMQKVQYLMDKLQEKIAIRVNFFAPIYNSFFKKRIKKFKNFNKIFQFPPLENILRISHLPRKYH